MIGIPVTDLGGLSLAAFAEAVAAYNAAHDDSGPVLTEADEDELAAMLGLE